MLRIGLLLRSPSLSLLSPVLVLLIRHLAMLASTEAYPGPSLEPQPRLRSSLGWFLTHGDTPFQA